jgi:putative phosphoesterase
MKIGLIADIHADWSALKLALDLLQGQGVDMILCAGDLVDKGLDGDAVVQRIRERQIPCVLGNHDHHAEHSQRWLLRGAGESTPYRLTDTTLAFLRHLPLTWHFERAGTRILLAHGRPWSHEDYLYVYSDKDSLREVVRHAQADVVILGHTHEPMAAQVGAGWIFNPGSVCGKHTYGSSTYAVLSLPDLGFRVLHVYTGQPVKVPFVQAP